MKEGRKYGLGAVLVTQQPGSIPAELLSQGDNFFVFHLLSAGDLTALKRANAHFSDDLLATLLNEPLVGHGIFWSSAAGTDRGARPYPLPIRVLSFEAENRILRDPSYNGNEVDCYASRLRETFRSALAAAGARTGAGSAGASTGSAGRSAGRDTSPVARSGVDLVLEELAADAAAAAPARPTWRPPTVRRRSTPCASDPSSPATCPVPRAWPGAGSRPGSLRPRRRKRSSATNSTGPARSSSRR